MVWRSISSIRGNRLRAITAVLLSMLFSTARKKRDFEGILRPPRDNIACNTEMATTPGQTDTMDTAPPQSDEIAMPASYTDAGTLVLFSDSLDLTEPTRKRPPSSPVKDDNPSAKKTIVSERIAVFEKAFLQAVKERRPARRKLMHHVDGDSFYTIPSFYLQHLLSNLQDADPRKVSGNNVNDKEKEKWQTLKGTLKQDVFARLITVCEDLRRDQPELF